MSLPNKNTTTLVANDPDGVAIFDFYDWAGQIPVAGSEVRHYGTTYDVQTVTYDIFRRRSADENFMCEDSTVVYLVVTPKLPD